MKKVSRFVGVALLCSCAPAPYTAYQYDNGADYVREGLYRIVDAQGKMGYADEQGRVVIAPRFAFGFPFEQGRAKGRIPAGKPSCPVPAASIASGKATTGIT